MKRIILWWVNRNKVPAPDIFHDCYGRGVNCNIDLVWSDRLLYQTFGKVK